jgi:hypothetical protein
MSFKTLATSGSLSLSNVQDINARDRSSSSMLHPNPTQGKFMVELDVAEKLNTKVKFN